MQELPHHLDRTVVIKATPETVFRFFTDSTRWASWWGAGSTIDANPGGKVYIRHPNGSGNAGRSSGSAPARNDHLHLRVRAAANPYRLEVRESPFGWNPTTTERGCICGMNSPKPARAISTCKGGAIQLSVFSNVVANEVYAGRSRSPWMHGSAPGPCRMTPAREELLREDGHAGNSIPRPLQRARWVGRPLGARRRGATLHARNPAPAQRSYPALPGNRTRGLGCAGRQRERVDVRNKRLRAQMPTGKLPRPRGSPIRLQRNAAPRIGEGWT